MENKSKMIMKVTASNKKSAEMFEATNKPNPKPKDIAALNQLLDENPYIWQQLGNLAVRVRERIIGMQCSDSHLIVEATKRKIAEMRDQLGWQNSSRLEKLIIEQVCMNWLRLNHLELVHEQKTRESHTFAAGEHWDKLLTQAQKRYLRACESLAKVRKLLAEAELREQQARNKRSKSAAIAQKILKNATS